MEDFGELDYEEGFKQALADGLNSLLIDYGGELAESEWEPVEASDIELALRPASVMVEALVAVPSRQAAEALAGRLDDERADEMLSAAMGTPVALVSAPEVVTLPLTLPEGDGVAVGLIIGIAVAAVLGPLLLLLLLLRTRRRRKLCWLLCTHPNPSMGPLYMPNEMRAEEAAKLGCSQLGFPPTPPRRTDLIRQLLSCGCTDEKGGPTGAPLKGPASEARGARASRESGRGSPVPLDEELAWEPDTPPAQGATPRLPEGRHEGRPPPLPPPIYLPAGARLQAPRPQHAAGAATPWAGGVAGGASCSQVADSAAVAAAVAAAAVSSASAGRSLGGSHQTCETSRLDSRRSTPSRSARLWAALTRPLLHSNPAIPWFYHRGGEDSVMDSVCSERDPSAPNAPPGPHRGSPRSTVRGRWAVQRGPSPPSPEPLPSGGKRWRWPRNTAASFRPISPRKGAAPATPPADDFGEGSQGGGSGLGRGLGPQFLGPSSTLHTLEEKEEGVSDAGSTSASRSQAAGVGAGVGAGFGAGFGAGVGAGVGYGSRAAASLAEVPGGESSLHREGGGGSSDASSAAGSARAEGSGRSSNWWLWLWGARREGASAQAAAEAREAERTGSAARRIQAVARGHALRSRLPSSPGPPPLASPSVSPQRQRRRPRSWLLNKVTARLQAAEQGGTPAESSRHSDPEPSTGGGRAHAGGISREFTPEQRAALAAGLAGLQVELHRAASSFVRQEYERALTPAESFNLSNASISGDAICSTHGSTLASPRSEHSYSAEGLGSPRGPGSSALEVESCCSAHSVHSEGCFSACFSAFSAEQGCGNGGFSANSDPHGGRASSPSFSAISARSGETDTTATTCKEALASLRLLARQLSPVGAGPAGCGAACSTACSTACSSPSVPHAASRGGAFSAASARSYSAAEFGGSSCHGSCGLDRGSSPAPPSFGLRRGSSADSPTSPTSKSSLKSSPPPTRPSPYPSPPSRGAPPAELAEAAATRWRSAEQEAAAVEAAQILSAFPKLSGTLAKAKGKAKGPSWQRGGGERARE